MDIYIFAKIFSQQAKKIYCQNNDSKNTNGFYLRNKETVLKVNSLFLPVSEYTELNKGVVSCYLSFG